MGKNHFKVLAIVSGILLLVMPHSTFAADKTLLKVPYYEQGTDGYCWAACLTMLVNYHRQPQDFLKPWDVVDYLDFGRNGRINLVFHGGKITVYLSLQTGDTAPALQYWYFWEKDDLKQYLIEQIVDNQEPVYLGFTGSMSAKHAVIVVGYENDDIFYVHDPDTERPGEKKTWDELKSSMGAVRNPTIAVSADRADNASKPVTVNILPPELDIQTLQFKSPLEGTLPDAAASANIHFNWYDEETTDYGFMSNGGNNGMSVPEIPDYYTMELNVVATNAEEREGRFVLTYTLAGKSSPDITSSGSENFTLAANGCRTLQFMPADLKKLSGACELKVSIADAGTDVVYDEFAIDISFGQGIQLSALQEYDDTLQKKVAKLSWNKITGDFNMYVIYKKTAQSAQRETAAFLPASVSEYTDTKYDEKQQTDYAVAAVKTPPLKYFVTSDEVTLAPDTGTTTSTTTTAVTGSTTTTVTGPDLSTYTCCYLYADFVTYCGATATAPAAYSTVGGSWGGDNTYRACPPDGYGSYKNGTFTSTSETFEFGLKRAYSLKVTFSNNDGLLMNTVTAKCKLTCMNKDEGCFGVYSEDHDITVSNISCKEEHDYSAGGTYILCEIKGGDVAGHIDAYSKKGDYYWGETDYRTECSTTSNDYTLISNEFFHDRTPAIRLYLRTAE